MIDLDKYKGHTPGPWTRHSDLNGPLVRDANGALVTAYLTPANADLVTDAPALLDEVKRLRWLLEQYGHDPDLRFAVEGW